MTGRWGKAGVRLTPTEITTNDARRAVAKQRRHAEEQEAYALWRAGAIRPFLITCALDVAGLWGPSVDEACGAREPDVDRWEDGTLYPTWEQFRKLAKLTGKTPRFFFNTAPPLRASETTLRFHLNVENEPPPVLSYPAHVVKARVQGTPQSLPLKA